MDLFVAPAAQLPRKATAFPLNAIAPRLQNRAPGSRPGKRLSSWTRTRSRSPPRTPPPRPPLARLAWTATSSLDLGRSGGWRARPRCSARVCMPPPSQSVSQKGGEKDSVREGGGHERGRSSFSLHVFIRLVSSSLSLQRLPTHPLRLWYCLERIDFLVYF